MSLHNTLKHKTIRFATRLVASLALLTLVSCHTEKKIVYFQDADSNATVRMAALQTIRVRPSDKIAVIVKCEDPEASTLFNQFNVNQILGSTNRFSVSGSNGIIGYTVDPDGKIDMPVIGKIQVAGLTRFEIADLVSKTLEQTGQARGASVAVEFVDLGVTVLGEVKAPGRKAITRDTYTILDAIADAGDLSIDAERTILLTRNTGDSATNFSLDLRNQSNLLSSPAFFLQQNDVLYVPPTAKKARASTVNGNTILSASFWVSIASLLASLLSIGLRYK